MRRSPRSELRTTQGWRSLDRVSLVLVVVMAAVLYWLWPGRNPPADPVAPIAVAEQSGQTTKPTNNLDTEPSVERPNTAETNGTQSTPEP